MAIPEFDDLIGTKYKAHGRNKEEGFDCYGLAIECCKRAGKPLIDVYYGSDKVPLDNLIAYIHKGVNVEQLQKSEKYCLVELEYNGNLHIGFMPDRQTVIHSTYNHGVVAQPLATLNPIAYYRVKNEDNNLQDTFGRSQGN